MAARPCSREDGGARALRLGPRALGEGLIERSPAPRPVGVDARGWGWRHASRNAWAVEGLDLAIVSGERVLLLGASGAGKSTLLRALAGVLGGDDEGESTGELLIDGVDPAAARGRVGLVLQDPDSQVILSRVGDDVAFGCENLGVEPREIGARVRDALDAVGLDLPLWHPTSELSGGEKQRLALAGVIAMRPGLVLLDEPTANLDPGGIVEVREAVDRMLEVTDATLVVIEHRVETWWHLVTRVIVLAPGGGVLADGAPDEIVRLHGDRLTRSGIWVPGFRPERTRARHVASGDDLVVAKDLSVARTPASIVKSHIELATRPGRCLAITGPNGVGKSTLGLTLAGLLAPAAGDVLAPGLAGSLDPRPIRWKSRELLTRIGCVFQDPEHQFLAVTVRDELALGARVLGLSGEEIDSRVDALLARLRLGHLARANPFTLSGGEKRRLSVATALVTRPAVVVLDEPTFGQDSRTWRELVELFGELLDEGSSLVIVTHDEDLVRVLADDELRLESRAGSNATAR